MMNVLRQFHIATLIVILVAALIPLFVFADDGAGSTSGSTQFSTIVLAANNNEAGITIAAGTSFTLSWYRSDENLAINAESCVGTNFTTGIEAPGSIQNVGDESGSTTLSPNSTTTYKIECGIYMDDGTFLVQTQDSLTVTVSSLSTVSLTADDTSITQGDSTTLRWKSSSVTSCTGLGFSTGGATSGSATVSPTSNTTYSISCGTEVSGEGVWNEGEWLGENCEVYLDLGDKLEGSCSPIGSTHFYDIAGSNCGAESQYIATYDQTCVEGDTVTQTVTDSVTVSVSVPNYTLSVNSSGASSVSITSSSATYSGTTNYTKSIANGTSLSLTAPATQGSANFQSWSGCNSASGRTCNLSINANKTVTANYATLSGSISADPETCTITGGSSYCSSTISWESTNAPQASILQTSNATGSSVWWKSAIPNGSASFDFVTEAGSTFTLYSEKSTSSTLLDSVVVKGEPEPTPPDVSFTAESPIVRGESATLDWNSINADSCTGSGFSTGSLPPETTSGTVEVSPTSDTTYSITCSNSGGDTTEEATVEVIPNYTLSVRSSGASSVSITGSSATYSGTTNYTKSIANGTSLSLTAPATKGSANFQSWSGCNSASGRTCNLSINANKTVTANYATPSVSAIITVFNVSPSSVALGDPATVEWDSDHTDSCSMTASGGLTRSWSFLPTSGTGTITPTSAETVNLTLICKNTSTEDTATASLFVSEKPTVTIGVETPILTGEPSTIVWVSTNTTSCTGTNFSTGGATSGTTEVFPEVDTRYSISCDVGAGGESGAQATAEAIVIIRDPQVSITANPQRVLVGRSARIEYSATDVDSCSVFVRDDATSVESTFDATRLSVEDTKQITSVEKETEIITENDTNSKTYIVRCLTDGIQKQSSVTVTPIIPEFEEL